MKKEYLSFLITVITTTCFFVATQGQQQSSRPKIGLTLSGGGAKGLAHIGILKAIDSAGLKIDYITGTSMGSIIGGLYAIGYPADSIEKMACAINWDLLLSNQVSLRTIFMEEKDEYNKYTLELPWVKNKFQLPTGVLQGQELWLQLAEMMSPVYHQKDFSRFSIPFKCIGTDIGNGEAVVMSQGEVTTAIRSSMAIPSFFTAVDYNGKRLVDGGIVRNFPVRDVKEMGANIVIGSNVSAGLLSSDKVRNALQVLLQVAFFREAQDLKEEVAMCDIYIPFLLDKFNMGSFAQANDILEIGLAEGRKLYPSFKKMADSLNAIYGPSAFVKNRMAIQKPIKISSYEVKGVKNTSADFFVHTMNFTNNKLYTPQKISSMVRAAYGTRYYSRISYLLEQQPDSSYAIVFDVTENPLSFAKVSLHYNKFSGVAAIANLTTRNFFITNSRSMLTINLGDAIRARAEHLQYVGRRKNFALIFNTQYDQFDINTYNTYKQDGLYKQQFLKVDFKSQYSTLRNFTIGIGQRFEALKYTPKIISSFQFKGNNEFYTSYFFINHNTLDKTVYPRKGIKISTEIGWVHRQNPDVRFFVNGLLVQEDSLQTLSTPYPRIAFSLDTYTPFTRHTVLEFLMQTGVNFNYKQNIMNEFYIGGLTALFRNQITFAGLQEGSVSSPAVAAFQLGLRQELLNNTFVIGKANILFNNFISASKFFNNPNILTGYALTFGYNFALGPLEFSLMYSDQSKKISSYVNIGIPF